MDRRKPPGWFRIALWGGLAGAAGVLGALISAAVQ